MEMKIISTALSANHTVVKPSVIPSITAQTTAMPNQNHGV